LLGAFACGAQHILCTYAAFVLLAMQCDGSNTPSRVLMEGLTMEQLDGTQLLKVPIISVRMRVHLCMQIRMNACAAQRRASRRRHVEAQAYGIHTWVMCGRNIFWSAARLAVHQRKPI